MPTTSSFNSGVQKSKILIILLVYTVKPLNSGHSRHSRSPKFCSLFRRGKFLKFIRGKCFKEKNIHYGYVKLINYSVLTMNYQISQIK